MTVRYLKKIADVGAFDLLVERSPCPHASLSGWRRTKKADKARKGLARLLGDDDWDKMEKCSRCRGGGVWRLTWDD